MQLRAIESGQRLFAWLRDSGPRTAVARYMAAIGFIAPLFAAIPHTPLDGPVGGVIALVSVVIVSWFAGTGPALLLPLTIWLLSRLMPREPDVNWIPSREQALAFIGLTLLTGAIGLSGQFQRRYVAASRRHAAGLRRYMQALSRAHIIFRDPDGRIVAWNEGAQQLYGYSGAEAVGSLIQNLLQTKFPVPWDEIHRNLSEQGQWQGEVRQRAKHGAELTVAVHYIQFAGDEANPGGVAEVHSDVTELRESEHRKDLFVATLAHELRNPLAPLRSGLDVLRLSRAGEDDSEAMIDIMERQLSHIVRMVDDLLDVSRINTGKVELRRTPVVLADVIRDAVETCRSQISDAQLDLQVALPDNSVALLADEDRLVQVFGNLLTNATKFTPAGGCIRLAAEHADRQVTIRVEDTGIGIAAEALPHVFDVFSQVDPLQNRAVRGLGLGLHLVRTFVEMHGGTVEARSEGPGRGAEFSVRLPTTNMAQQVRAPSAQGHPLAKASDKHRVLVVDDNQDAARTLSLLLSKLGFECQTAFDGPSALSLADDFEPHAIVLDLGMPGMNGLQVARRLRSPPDPSTALLIALTGWDKEEDRRNTREAGFDHHLAKPVAFDELQELLCTLPKQTIS